MRLSSGLSPLTLIIASLLAFLPFSSAIRLLQSKSLNPCQANSSFTASLFNVIFTPNNYSIYFDIVGVSSIQGKVIADLEVIAYGYTAVKTTLDPCTAGLDGMCPMSTGQINIESNINNIPKSDVDQIPGIAYGVPDLDGLVRVYINDTDTGESVACVEAQLSNGKTVDQKAVGWTTAVIAGIALIVSAVTSGLGHSNTAAHVAANAISLFGYFQAQAFIGMTAVTLPPIVQSWTQNFQWSMGIVRVGFLQNIATWYQRSTGGTPSNLLDTLSTTSVEIQKRSLETVNKLWSRGSDLYSRSNGSTKKSVAVTVVRGIKRVGFRAKIERTNIFFTGLAFFVIFVVFLIIAVTAFKGMCEMASKAGWMKGTKFQDFRNGWLTVLKGILFRMVLIGYPQIVVLCLWEFTQVDSAAEVVLAIFFFAVMSLALLWASFKVIRIAKRSTVMHKNPAYILYSDPAALNKWGFLYVQFRATAYYFIIPLLVYVLIKGMFLAFGQGSGTVQAIGFLVIEGVFLIGVCIYRPYMDKKTNAFNISIAAINFLNSVFLLVFTAIFNQPGIVTGVMGVIFFVMNAVFALVLLLMVLISSIYALLSKNPDTRYQPMRDDRGSFIKSQGQMTTELDALGATARGDGSYKRRDLDEDEDSFSSSSINKQTEATAVPLPSSEATSQYAPSHREAPLSPIDASLPLFPSNGPARHGPPSYSDAPPRDLYSGFNGSGVTGTSDVPLVNRNPGAASPAPRGQDLYSGPPSVRSNVTGYRSQNNSSPWQRGAGYDHS
ncbi:MAG: hypothetical protein M1819_006535 [Sarea resinae]|nr:MAG: hypothetical protein M1819_006535 [Sarea resinae]